MKGHNRVRVVILGEAAPIVFKSKCDGLNWLREVYLEDLQAGLADVETVWSGITLNLPKFAVRPEVFDLKRKGRKR